MGYEDVIRDFHNQKEPDFDPDSGALYSSNSKEYDDYIKYLEALDDNNSEKSKSELIDLKKKIEDINDQDKEKVKENVLGLIDDTYNYSVQYVELVRQMGYLRDQMNKSIDKDEFRNLRVEMQTIDQARFRKHEALIDSINILNRYIMNNFDDFVSLPLDIDTSDRHAVASWAIKLVKSFSNIEKSPD